MRIFPLSDLHLERRSPDSIAGPAGPFDVLACAGDLHEGHPERGLAALVRLARGRPIVLVPGNHESYAPANDPRTAPQLLAALEAEALRLNARGARIHLLRGGACAVVAGVRFVGATLWSDWRLAGRWLVAGAAGNPADPAAFAAARMTDPATGSREYLGAIRKADGAAWRPADAMAAHAAERAALFDALRRLRHGLAREDEDTAAAVPTVVVTHHPASPLAVDRYRDAPGVPWWIPAFYATTVLDDLPEAERPDAWVSGHFHAGHDMRLGRCRWVSNPVEGATYRPDFFLDVAAGPRG